MSVAGADAASSDRGWFDSSWTLLPWLVCEGLGDGAGEVAGTGEVTAGRTSLASVAFTQSGHRLLYSHHGHNAIFLAGNSVADWISSMMAIVDSRSFARSSGSNRVVG